MSTTYPKSRGKKTLMGILTMLVFITNMSQMPYFVDGSLTQLISIPLWIVLLIYALHIGDYPSLKNIRTPVGLGFFFLLFAYVMSAFSPAYLRSALIYPTFIVLFVLIVGTSCGKDFSDNDFNKIYVSYIWSTFIVSVSVYHMYIYGNALDGPTYLYDSKNSISQILLTAWTLIIFTRLHRGKFIVRLAYLLVLLFLTFEIFALKSRASIIGMPFILLIGCLLSGTSRKVKNIIILIIVGSALILMNDEYYDTFESQVLFAGRDHNDIDALSSGRSGEWDTFGDEFMESPLVGVGRCKRESIILTSLLEFGLIGGIPLLLMACQPLSFAWKQRKRHNPNNTIFLALSFVYILNGVFEQLAPLGPGVKCYFIWLLYGIMAQRNK